MAPEAVLSHLHRADGSATYSQHGYTIIGAVNGPIEVLRKDEMPLEATVEVNVRPAFGVGTVEERHIETLLHNALRNVILVRKIPRTKVEITLQIKSLPEEHAVCGVYRTLTILPHLLHTALLALLSSSIPLQTTVTSALVVIPEAKDATPLVIPTAKDIFRAKPIKSAHVFAFSGDRQLLLSESEGEFSLQELDDACEQAEEICCKEGGVGLADAMQTDEPSENLEAWLREVVKRKVEEEQKWRGAT